MPRPVVIAVAITGSVPRKKDSAAVPVSPAEQIESTHEAYECGASLVHVHVRDEDEAPSCDPARYAQVLQGVRRFCPGMIVEFSTGGRGRTAAERAAALRLGPDMASLATGSVNFSAGVYENSPDLVETLARAMIDRSIKPEIEILDTAMLYSARDLLDRGLIKAPAHVQFVFGVKNALPARRCILEFLLSELRELLPGATWTAGGIGRHQVEVMRWSLELGGHVRTGLEDNLKLNASRLADSNAALVRQAVEVCAAQGARPATAAEARALLGLTGRTAGADISAAVSTSIC